MHSQELALVLITCFLVMFIITGLRAAEKNNRLFGSKGKIATDFGSLLSMHAAGILWFGIVPMIFSDQRWEILFNGNDIPTRWIMLIGTLLIIIIICGAKASRAIHLELSEYSLSIIRNLPVYFLFRIIYLCAYEIFFRGIVLFSCIEWFGTLPAIVISTLLTVLIHLFTNKKEMIGSIPFGIILSIGSIELHSVWPAILLHTALSFSYELPPVKQFIMHLKLTR